MYKKFASKKISVSICGIFICLMWIAIADQVNREEKQAIETQKNYLHNIATGLREYVQASFQSTDDALRLLKFHYESSGVKDLPAINRYFRSKVIDISTLNQVGVIDEHGIYVFSNLDFHKKIDLSDREHFKVHKEGYPSPLFFSKPVLGRASGKWSFQITRKLEKPDGSFNGVAVASFNPVQFLEQFQRAGLDSSSLVGLVGLDGYARALRVGNSNRADDTLRDLKLPIEVGYAESGSFVSKKFFDTAERLYVFEKISSQPLFVVVGMNTATALTSYYYHRNVLLGSGLILTLVAVVLTFLRLKSMENYKQLESEVACQRQAYESIRSAYEACLEKTKNLIQLSDTGVLALSHTGSIKSHIKTGANNLHRLQECIDVTEAILQESLRVDLGLSTPQDFLNIAKKMSADINLEILRENFVETSFCLNEIAKLVDDVEKTQN
jgi:hypothetical protein